MNKIEYINQLKQYLRHLPKEDFDKAIDYFEEYFNDAGVENEDQVIENLGTPEFAAKQIITNIAVSNSKEPVPGVKKKLNAVWIGILSVCAAPIALPLALAIIVVIIAFLFSIFMIIVCVLFSGILLIVCGPLSIIAGFTIIASSFPAFLSCIGLGLTTIGAGIMIAYGIICFAKWFLSKMLNLFGRIAQKGGKRK